MKKTVPIHLPHLWVVPLGLCGHFRWWISQVLKEAVCACSIITS